MSDRKFILDNLEYRLSVKYPDRYIDIGYGNVYPGIVIIHHNNTIPERDGTSGALKRFNLLDEVYRIPLTIVNNISDQENRKILIELLEILRPLVIVTSGQDATEILKNKKLRSFKIHCGKEFSIEDLTFCRMYAILNPEEYSFARASSSLKEQGKKEWERLAKIFDKEHREKQLDRWKVMS